MNMKKSIAGVMAGAMAISAMATVASADQEQIVLSYDLKGYVHLCDVSTVSITAKYADSTSGYAIQNLTNGATDVTFGLSGIGVSDYELTTVALSGTQIARLDENGAYVTSAAPSATYYSAAALGKEYQKDTSGDMSYLADTDNVVCMENSWSNSISSDKKSFTVKFATKDAVTSNGYVGSYVIDTLAVTSGATEGTEAEDGVYVVSGKTAVVAAVPGDTTYVAPTDKKGEATGTEAADAEPFATEAAAKAAAAEVTAPGTVSVIANGDNFIIKVVGEGTPASGGETVYYTEKGNAVKVTDESKAPTFTTNAAAVDAAAEAAKANATDTDITVKELKAPVEATTGTAGTVSSYSFGSYSITYTVKAYGQTWDGSWNYLWATPSNTNLEGSPSKVSVTAANYAGAGSWFATAGVSKSSLDAGLDVIEALQAVKNEGYTYTNPISVINDVLANNEEVAFTFTSIPGSVKTGLNTKTGISNQVFSDTWSGDWSHPTFGQHLYGTNNVTDTVYAGNSYSNYGSYSSAWGTNLFTAGITVNSKYTMQLNDTTAFTWGDNSVTFLWSSITDGKVSNATSFLSSMLLYTPVDWYWDSLDISVGSAISEDIVPGAGIEDDGDVVVDDETDADADVEVDDDEDFDVDYTDDDEFADDDDDYADDDFDDDDFGDEDFDSEFDDEFDGEDDVDTDVDTDADTSADVDAAPAEVASPQTGNAPIALAVIPVALAAAAVVAKKKN